MDEQRPRARGVVDIVFLIDCTGSMQPCIDSLRENISKFIDYLTVGDANNQMPVRDWRGRVIGYRDVPADGANWYVDNPFVRDANQLKSQLSGLTATGGGDEPESLLDALYKVANFGQTEKGAEENPRQWRYRSGAGRVVVVFTDATYHPTLSIPEARGGKLDDIKHACHTHRIILSIFAPDMECYNLLAAIDKSEYNAIEYDTAAPNGPQKALAAFTAHRANFDTTLRQLAASVSRSSVPETL